MEKGSLFEKFGTVIEAGRVIFKEDEPGDTMYINSYCRAVLMWLLLVSRDGPHPRRRPGGHPSGWQGERMVDYSPSSSVALSVSTFRLYRFITATMPSAANSSAASAARPIASSASARSSASNIAST